VAVVFDPKAKLPMMVCTPSQRRSYDALPPWGRSVSPSLFQPLTRVCSVGVSTPQVLFVSENADAGGGAGGFRARLLELRGAHVHQRARALV